MWHHHSVWNPCVQWYSIYIYIFCIYVIYVYWTKHGSGNNLRFKDLYIWLHTDGQSNAYSSSLLSSSLNLRSASSFSWEFSFILPIMLSSRFLCAVWISWTIPGRNSYSLAFIYTCILNFLLYHIVFHYSEYHGQCSWW